MNVGDDILGNRDNAPSPVVGASFVCGIVIGTSSSSLICLPASSAASSSSTMSSMAISSSTTIVDGAAFAVSSLARWLASASASAAAVDLLSPSPLARIINGALVCVNKFNRPNTLPPAGAGTFAFARDGLSAGAFFGSFVFFARGAFFAFGPPPCASATVVDAAPKAFLDIAARVASACAALTPNASASNAASRASRSTAPSLNRARFRPSSPPALGVPLNDADTDARRIRGLLRGVTESARSFPDPPPPRIGDATISSTSSSPTASSSAPNKSFVRTPSSSPPSSRADRRANAPSPSPSPSPSSSTTSSHAGFDASPCQSNPIGGAFRAALDVFDADVRVVFGVACAECSDVDACAACAARSSA